MKMSGLMKVSRIVVTMMGNRYLSVSCSIARMLKSKRSASGPSLTVVR